VIFIPENRFAKNMTRPVLFFLLICAPVLALCLIYLGWQTASTNLLGWFIAFFGAAFLMGGLIYLPGLIQGQTARRAERNDLSFWLILPGFLVVFYITPLEYLYLPDILPRTVGMQITGLALLAAGIALRVWARRALGSLYSGHVQIQASHHLVKSGPYRYVRHPGYTGFLLMLLGLAIGYSSLIGLAAIPLLFLPGIAYRIQVEETLLAEEYGEDFSIYAQSSSKLIPGIW